MRQWLYKATDTETEARRRRPGFEVTSALAVTDGILCRSAFDRARPRKAKLVWRVAVGDLLHVYHRQYAESQGVRFVGNFRVVDPGSSRFAPECALARVDDADLAARLRDVYDIPPEDPVTGWYIEPAADAHEPVDHEQLKSFLMGRSTLMRYAPRRIGVAADRTTARAGRGSSQRQNEKLRLENDGLKKRVEELGQRLAEHESEDADVSVPVDAYTRWIESHLDELRRYPHSWVVLDADSGIVFHSTDGAEFAAELDKHTPEDRDRLMVFNTSMYV